MRLLFAVDLSEEFESVFEQAVTWARGLGATLDLVYVGVYDDIYQFITDPHVRTLLASEAETLKAEHRRALEALLARVPEAQRGEAFLPSGPPAAAIVALEEPYDALLVATHGRTGLSHVWLGSVAERIVRTSRKPVVVLRMPVHPA